MIHSLRILKFIIFFISLNCCYYNCYSITDWSTRSNNPYNGMHLLHTETFNNKPMRNINRILFTATSSGAFLYVAGINEIKQLREDLSLVTQITTGPNISSIFCHDPKKDCFCPGGLQSKDLPSEYKPGDCNGRLTDVIVKAWTVTHDSLCLCYNVFWGSCERRKLHNIRQLSINPQLTHTDTPIPVVGFDPNTQVVIVPSQSYLIVAQEKTPYTLIPSPPYASISSRTFDFKLVEYISQASPWVRPDMRFSSVNEEYFIKYRGGFTYEALNGERYLYVAMAQAESLDVKKWHSRIARICNEDYLFSTYVELTLRCHGPLESATNHAPEDYNVLTHLYVAHVGSTLAKELGIRDYLKEKVLFASFQSHSLENSKNKLNLKPSTALCLYPMAEVNRKFNDVIDRCLNGEGQRGPMHYIIYAGQDVGTQCKKSNPNLNSANYCILKEKADNWPIGGTSYVDSLPTTYFALLHDKIVTGLTASPVSKTDTVVTVTTTDGQIIKLEVLGKSLSVEVGNFQPSNDKEELVGIELHHSSYEAYVASTNKVYHLALQQCNRASTCLQCVSLHDPYCGWCSFNGLCTTSIACKYGWIAYKETETHCPRIVSIKPSGIRKDQDQEIILTLKLQNINLIPSATEHLYCVYRNFIDEDETNIGNIINSYPAEIGKDSAVSCYSPKGRQMPTILDGHSNASVHLSLELRKFTTSSATTTEEVQNMGESKFYVYHCSAHKTCVSCTDSGFPCSWCALGGYCVNEMSFKSCPSTYSQQLLVIKREESYNCPMFSTQQNHILHMSGGELSFTATLINKQLFMKDFRCRETCTNVSALAKLDGNDTLFCKFPKIIFNSFVPVRNCTVMIEHDKYGVVVPFENKQITILEMFDCSALAQHCDDCSALALKYNCGWCETSGSCVVRDSCLRDWITTGICPNPKITEISPEYVSLAGRAKITISGRNLGNDVSQFSNTSIIIKIKTMDENSPYLSSLPCEVIPESYLRSKLVSCLLGEMPNQWKNQRNTLKGIVFLSVGGEWNKMNMISSGTKPIYFVQPKVTDVSPKRGPIDGGTILLISGAFLDSGNNQRVYLLSTNVATTKKFTENYASKCIIHQKKNNSISCTIESKPKGLHISPSSSSMMMMISPQQQQVEGVQNLVFHHRRRRSNSRDDSYAGILMLLIVEIDNDPISNPQVTFAYGQNPNVTLVNRRDFLKSGGLSIHVTGSDFDMIDRPKTQVKAHDRWLFGECKMENNTFLLCDSPTVPQDVEIPKEGLEVLFGFVMDNVKSVREFGKAKIYPDPIVERFPNDGTMTIIRPFISTFNTNGQLSKLSLTIFGRFPIPALLLYGDVRVVVGNFDCLEVRIKENQLECDLQSENYLNDHKYHVSVRIGEVNRFDTENLPGLIVFQEEYPYFWHIIIGVAILIVIILISLVLGAYLCFRHKAKKTEKKNKCQRGKDINNLYKQIARQNYEVFFTIKKYMNMRRQCFGSIPFRDYQEYCQFFIGPEESFWYETIGNFNTNTTSSPPNNYQINENIRNLLHNREFLMDLCRLVNKSTKGQRYKLRLGTLLSLLLYPDFNQYTEIMFALISEFFDHKEPLMMFRPSNSVQEQLISNWFVFLLYSAVLDRVGDPLFTLYHALLAAMWIGPVDVEEDKTLYSLDFQHILTEQLDFQRLKLFVNDASGELFSRTETLEVDALDCDAIIQLKEKIFHAHYKNQAKRKRKNIDDFYLILMSDEAPPQTLTPYNDTKHFTLKDYLNESQQRNSNEPTDNHSNKSIRIQLASFHGNDDDSSYSTMPSTGRTASHMLVGNNVNYDARRPIYSSEAYEYRPLLVPSSPQRRKRQHLVSVCSEEDDMLKITTTTTATTVLVPQEFNGHLNGGEHIAMNDLPLLPHHHHHQHPHFSSIGTTNANAAMMTPILSSLPRGAAGGGVGGGGIIAGYSSAHSSPYPTSSRGIITSAAAAVPQGVYINSRDSPRLSTRSTPRVHYSAFPSSDKKLLKKSQQQQQQNNHGVKKRRQSKDGGKSKYQSDRQKQEPKTILPKELGFNYVLTTKYLVSDYIMELIDSLFTPIYRDKNAPLCVKYFFHFLDNMASASSLGEEYSHRWKTNTLSLRYWVPLVSNPHFVFDIDFRKSVSGSMKVISDLIVYACSFNIHNLKDDGSFHKQIFGDDINPCQEKVKQYYSVLKKQGVDIEEVRSMLTNHSSAYNLRYNEDAIITEIYNDYIRDFHSELKKKNYNI